MLVFRKQIDNLKTNHRGVYVLTDNSFRPFSRMSMVSPSEAVAKAQPVRILMHTLRRRRGSSTWRSFVKLTVFERAVLVVSVRHHQRRPRQSGHRCHRSGGDFRAAGCVVSDQDGSAKALRRAW